MRAWYQILACCLVATAVVSPLAQLSAMELSRSSEERLTLSDGRVLDGWYDAPAHAVHMLLSEEVEGGNAIIYLGGVHIINRTLLHPPTPPPTFAEQQRINADRDAAQRANALAIQERDLRQREQNWDAKRNAELTYYRALARSTFWATQGITFDPQTMTAPDMDTEGQRQLVERRRVVIHVPTIESSVEAGANPAVVEQGESDAESDADAEADAEADADNQVDVPVLATVPNNKSVTINLQGVQPTRQPIIPEDAVNTISGDEGPGLLPRQRIWFALALISAVGIFTIPVAVAAGHAKGSRTRLAACIRAVRGLWWVAMAVSWITTVVLSFQTPGLQWPWLMMVMPLVLWIGHCVLSAALVVVADRTQRTGMVPIKVTDNAAQ